MYLSRLIISNYRSIKELDLKFKKGKNVIVGKNNAGKSNIIKAIDILLGESSPAYHKYENITEVDFHAGQTDKPIFIFGELLRDSHEELNYNEIYKCLGYKFHIENKQWIKEAQKHQFYTVRHQIRANSVENFCTDLDSLMNIIDDDVQTFYVNPKLKNQLTFEEQLNDKYVFGFAFRAVMLASKKVDKEIRFFYRENYNQGWIMSFSAPVRCELLQSAIIPSFRDPSNELRINQWTWFGKLLKTFINTNDPALKSAFDMVKNASDGIFGDLVSEINNSKVKVAFPDTTVSFQFNHDNKIDIYKSALIYVDDGFNSLLQDKGSGIQSAVTIGLFHYYTRYIAHAPCSLLAIEEPELYLHPQARRVISNRIDDFLDGQRNQVIITTHSPEFITSAHERLNVILARKSANNGTEAKNTTFEDSKEKQILIKVQNAEMFFADIVLLVEGGEKYIIEAYAKYYGKVIKPELGPNWLNDKNLSVIAVGGKNEFWKYYKKLNSLKINCFILGDFDFLLRRFSEFLTNVGAQKQSIDELNALKSKLPIQDIPLKRTIITEIENFKNKISQDGYELDEKDLKIKLKEPFKVKKLSQISQDYHSDIKVFLEKYKKIGIHILEGELEDYYTESCKKILKGITGKEEKPIHIVSQLIDDKISITDLIDCTEYKEFFDSVTKGIPTV